MIAARLYYVMCRAVAALAVLGASYVHAIVVQLLHGEQFNQCHDSTATAAAAECQLSCC